jgi:hypothetical protein
MAQGLEKTPIKTSSVANGLATNKFRVECGSVTSTQHEEADYSFIFIHFQITYSSSNTVF